MQPFLPGIAVGAALSLFLWPRPSCAQEDSSREAGPSDISPGPGEESREESPDSPTTDDVPSPPTTDVVDSAGEPDGSVSDPRQGEEPQGPGAPPEPNDASAPESSIDSGPPPADVPPSDPTDESPKELVPRLDGPKESPRQSAAFAPPPATPVEPVVMGPPDRHEEMPAQMVRRPLSLPRGTLELEWALSGVFVDHTPTTAHMPSFTWGISDRVELGLTGAFRFDDGADDWTALDPTPHLLITALDRNTIEWGIFGSVLIPGSDDTKPQVTFALPLLVRASERWRLDADPRVEWSSEKGVGSLLGLRLDAHFQATRAVYLGWGIGPELGLGQKRDSGLDAHLTIGATMQTRGRALVDVEGAFFFENLGGGPPDHFSDGGGFTASIRFFPEMY